MNTEQPPQPTARHLAAAEEIQRTLLSARHWRLEEWAAIIAKHEQGADGRMLEGPTPRTDAAHLAWIKYTSQFVGRTETKDEALTRALTESRPENGFQFARILERELTAAESLPSLESELAELKRDKARLDWLDAHPRNDWNGCGIAYDFRHLICSIPVNQFEKLTSRQAIDAAAKFDAKEAR